MSRFWSLALLGTAALVVTATVLRVPVYWGNEARMDMPTGVWFALAKDTGDGIFYRPVESAEGFGGTRYFPLQFVLHAGVARFVHGDLLVAAHTIVVSCAVVLLTGAYLLLRRTGASIAVAAGSAGLIVATRPVQDALMSFRGDLLPSALGVWGLALCAHPTPRRRTQLAAGVLLALAMAAKVTSVFALAVALVYFWQTGRRREALRVLGGFGAAAVLGLLLVVAASNGRAIEAWQVGAGSGLDLARLVRAPWQFAKIVREVPETLVFVHLALSVFLVWNLPRFARGNLASLLFLITFAVTVGIFAIEGADSNHFLDLQVASVVVVAAWTVSTEPAAARVGIASLSIAGLAALMSLGTGLVRADREVTRGTVREALAIVGPTNRPILAENPLVAVAAGQRPYMLDPYLFRIARANRPAMADRLWADLDARRFGAVVLDRDPFSEKGRAWYGSLFFGEGFVEHLVASYREAGRVRQRVVYLPKPR